MLRGIAFISNIFLTYYSYFILFLIYYSYFISNVHGLYFQQVVTNLKTFVNIPIYAWKFSWKKYSKSYRAIFHLPIRQGWHNSALINITAMKLALELVVKKRNGFVCRHSVFLLPCTDCEPLGDRDYVISLCGHSAWHFAWHVWNL